MTTPPRSKPRQDKGVILIVALFLLMVIASVALLLARSTQVDASSSANYVAKVQAEAASDGAIAYARSILDSTSGQVPADNSFYNQRMPLGQGYFWVIKHDFLTDNNIRFGLSDQAALININTAPLNTLIQIPPLALDPDIAADILSWRTPGNQGSSSSGGVGSDYYLSLPDPYNAKGAPFETTEELLLIQDVTPAVLYGLDTNRNSILDPGEDINHDGMLLPTTRGLADYVTIYSREQNTNANNQPRTNVNGNNTNALRAVLSAAGISATRINTILSRITTIANTPTSQPTRGTTTVATSTFRNVIDFYYRSGMTIAEFQKVADNLTWTTQNPIRGLININTASPDVLMCLPSMTQSFAEAIVAHRGSQDPNATPTPYNTLADLINVIPQTVAVQIGGLITTRSFRVAADILAVDATGRSFKRTWVVFDSRSSPVRAIYYRDLTDLGWPLDQQTLADLRAGVPLAPPNTPVSPQAASNNPTGAP